MNEHDEVRQAEATEVNGSHPQGHILPLPGQEVKEDKPAKERKAYPLFEDEAVARAAKPDDADQELTTVVSPEGKSFFTWASDNGVALNRAVRAAGWKVFKTDATNPNKPLSQEQLVARLEAMPAEELQAFLERLRAKEAGHEVQEETPAGEPAKEEPEVKEEPSRRRGKKKDKVS